jgi:dephospho-CoA kinase
MALTSHRPIALAGKMAAGKTELARYLHRNYGYSRLSSSELCRTIARLIFHDESRTHLNQLGDALRKLDENIWIKAILPAEQHSNIVVDSVRYISEALFLRDLGFQVWRVTTDEKVRYQRLLTRMEPDIADHASEVELDNFNYDFVFDSTGGNFDAVDSIIRKS